MSGRWRRYGWVAGTGLVGGLVVLFAISHDRIPPHAGGGEVLKAAYRIDHLTRRPTDATDPYAAEDAALWDAAEAEGYRWADDNAPDDVKACGATASPAFRARCAEWVAEQRETSQSSATMATRPKVMKLAL